ncbi:response regulator transcription factor [Neopusillimonas maritima]|uniref:HTH luxR-type domain-containing protein n=1 Tax=Neopusillimonas maritima TaxID=2026239 RepID=A0ABX9N089_9BURK|nr:helix-turn-helix transcriptional regulator [Neopusillimonas maritima]RII84502.1 hypothetical protein CJO09_04660 [Neopusillimonas maritima]
MDQTQFEVKPFCILSPREREVMLGIVEGMSNKYIALEMALSQRTVEAHRARIFDKTDVRNAVQLTRLWLRSLGISDYQGRWPVYRFCKAGDTQGAVGPSGMRECNKAQCSASHRCAYDAVISNGFPYKWFKDGSSLPADL